MTLSPGALFGGARLDPLSLLLRKGLPASICPPKKAIAVQAAQPKGSSMQATVEAILKQKGSRVWTIPGEATVFEAIQLMAARNIGALVVVSGHKLEGIFSERDYTRKVALHGKSSKETFVSEVLSHELHVASPQNTIEECMRLMTENRVRHLPVLDGEALVGLVSIGDLVNWIISAQSMEITQLHSYISGQYPG
jgi:CBS domain-containing protein